MPDKASSEYRGEAAAAAFDRVLAAEVAAEAAVEESRRQAAALVDAARERQRALEEDAEARIAAWRRRLAGKADARVAAFQCEATCCMEAVELDAAARGRIAPAVARLAAELVDGD